MKKDFKTAKPNELENTENQEGEVAGFWLGFWHGLIAPVTFVLSLFKEDIGVYEVHNNGRWYNFGFIFGLMLIFGGNKGVNMQADKQKKESE
jgi:hypothetical protein